MSDTIHYTPDISSPKPNTACGRNKGEITSSTDVRNVDCPDCRRILVSWLTGKRVEKTITVCAACGRASCWNGWLYCENYRTAGTVDLPFPRGEP